MADRRLQVFHAVARQLSFTAAAETLFMTQPAATFQSNQLEEHFNTRLFDHVHGRTALMLDLGFVEAPSRLANTFIEFAKEKLRTGAVQMPYLST